MYVYVYFVVLYLLFVLEVKWLFQSIDTYFKTSCDKMF